MSLYHTLVLATTWKAQTSRRIIEIGLLAGLVSGVVFALPGGSRFLLRALAGLLLALAFGLTILAVHFGKSPFRG